MKVVVAMSGGVDSSVTAHLLREQGHEIIGMMMKMWNDPLAPPVRTSPKSCCSVEHIARARAVSEKLGVPFYVVDVERAFKEKVVDPFLEGHARGKTPNPCVECNKHIKFGSFLEKAKELGCDKVASGHYARIATEQEADGGQRYLLLQGVDTSRDQSYYLYTLTQEKLARILFPLGAMEKKEVYRLATAFGISIPSHYRETQDVCFYPEKNKEAFLRRYLGEVKRGDIRTEDGKKVGTHKGLPFYTIGQRKGLGIGGLRIPLHVSRVEPHTNTLFVAEDGKDHGKSVQISSLSWISRSPRESEEVKLFAKVHSTGENHPGSLLYRGKEGTFTFDTPQRGIAPGQALVLYKDQEVMGGGTIIFPPS